MKRTDFLSPAARLEDALQQLEAAWMATRVHWNDSISRTVEDEYLVPLHSQVRTLCDAVTKMSGVVRKAEHECTHERERHTGL